MRRRERKRERKKEREREREREREKERKRQRVYLNNWCFEPSQPLGIISGLKETFIKRQLKGLIRQR